MKSLTLFLITVAFALQSIGADISYDPRPHDYPKTHWRVRTYSDSFRKLGRMSPEPVDPTALKAIEAMRSEIGNTILKKTKSGTLGFPDPREALAYVLESSLENSFHPGRSRDTSLSLVKDYGRYLNFIDAMSAINVKHLGLRLSVIPNFGDIQIYRALCPDHSQLAKCTQDLCEKYKNPNVIDCQAKLLSFFGSHHQDTRFADVSKEIFWPSQGGEKCIGSGALANIKLAFIIEALMKRGRIVPVSPATRLRLAKTHSRGKQWVAESQSKQSVQMSTRLLKNITNYELLGLYDCSPDKDGLSGKIYIDATLNPYDLATLMMHELNHFAADKYATQKQININKLLKPNEVSFLEDIGSFTISALSQIDMTLNQAMERGPTPTKFNVFTGVQTDLQKISIATGRTEIAQIKDLGDLTRFSLDTKKGGALSAYFTAEKELQRQDQSQLYETKLTIKPMENHTICAAAEKLPHAWMGAIKSEKDSHGGFVTTPIGIGQHSQIQNIFHHIADGCYKNINVAEIQKSHQKEAMNFSYVPILDEVLKKQWKISVENNWDLERLRQLIDRDIGDLLGYQSEACYYQMLGTDGGKAGKYIKPANANTKPAAADGRPGVATGRAGVEGGKSGVEGGKSGVEGGKSGVEGGKAAENTRPVIDTVKPAGDVKP